MVQFSLLAAAALLPSALAGVVAPEARSSDDALEPRQGGYYFQNWSEGGSNIRCQNGAGGSFSANWSGKGGFVCGKGWRGGGARYFIRFIPSPGSPPLVKGY